MWWWQNSTQSTGVFPLIFWCTSALLCRLGWLHTTTGNKDKYSRGVTDLRAQPTPASGSISGWRGAWQSSTPSDSGSWRWWGRAWCRGGPRRCSRTRPGPTRVLLSQFRMKIFWYQVFLLKIFCGKDFPVHRLQIRWTERRRRRWWGDRWSPPQNTSLFGKCWPAG